MMKWMMFRGVMVEESGSMPMATRPLYGVSLFWEFKTHVEF